MRDPEHQHSEPLPKSIDFYAIKKDLQRFQVLTNRAEIDELFEEIGGYLGYTEKRKIYFDAHTRYLTFDSVTGSIIGYRTRGQAFAGSFEDPKIPSRDDEEYTSCEQETGIHPWNYLDLVQTRATENIRKYVVNKLPLTEESKKHYPSNWRVIQRGQQNFTTIGGEIGLGTPHLSQLADALKSKDQAKLTRAEISIESQTLHEVIHGLSEELGTDTLEEMTQLGEFLYDPANNPERMAVFSYFHKKMLSENPHHPGIEAYLDSWKNVGSVILVHELIQAGKIQSDELKDLPSLFLRLPNLYGTFSMEERMNILNKYLTIPVNELYDFCKKIADVHQLTYID